MEVVKAICYQVVSSTVNVETEIAKAGGGKSDFCGKMLLVM